MGTSRARSSARSRATTWPPPPPRTTRASAWSRALPRRRHGRQLLDLVPDARRGARRMGLARRAGVHVRGLHGQPRRGLRAAGGQPGVQRPVDPRAEAARRLPRARVACRRDAARRAQLRAGQGVRVLRARVPGRRQAVGRQDVAGRRARRRGAADRAQPRSAGCWSRAARPAGSSASPPRASRSTIRSRAVIAACGAMHTPALFKRSGLPQPEHRQAPEAASGERGVGGIRRGAEAVGGRHAGALFRPVP